MNPRELEQLNHEETTSVVTTNGLPFVVIAFSQSEYLLLHPVHHIPIPHLASHQTLV